MSVCQTVSWVFLWPPGTSPGSRSGCPICSGMGKGGNWERHQGAMEVCCISAFGARKGTKDVKMEMLQWCQEQAQAVAEAQQRAVVQAFAGWVYMEGAKVENIISTNNIQQLCGRFVAGGTMGSQSQTQPAKLRWHLSFDSRRRLLQLQSKRGINFSLWTSPANSEIEWNKPIKTIGCFRMGVDFYF